MQTENVDLTAERDANAFARALLREASESVRRKSEDDRSAETLMPIWRVQRAAGDADGAAETLARAWEAVRAETGLYKNIAIIMIAEAQTEAGNFDAAWQTVEAFDDMSMRIIRQCIIVQDQRKAGDEIGARERFASVQTNRDTMDDSDWSRVRLTIAQTQAEFGNATAVKETLAVLLEEALQADSDSKRASLLLRVAKEKMFAHDAAGVRVMVETIAAGAVRDTRERAGLLESIAMLQLGVCFIAVGGRIAGWIPEADRDPEAMPHTIALAEQSAKAAPNPGGKVATLRYKDWLLARAADTDTIPTDRSLAEMLGQDGTPQTLAARIARLGNIPGGGRDALDARTKAGDFTGARAVIDGFAPSDKSFALALLAAAVLDAGAPLSPP